MKGKTTITCENEVWEKLQFLRITEHKRTMNEVIKLLIERYKK